VKAVKSSLWFAGVALLAALSACAPKPPPPPPPPPPVVVVPVPPRPIPPDNASRFLVVPRANAAGLRESVNRNISPAQTTWNLRSAYNVAALNCSDAKHAEVLVNYRAFLSSHKRTLRAVNLKVDGEWRARYGSGFVPYREMFMTRVYNHFALPPTLPALCDAVLVTSREATTIKSSELEAFAFRTLPSIEVIYDDFYRRYEAYSVLAAAWDARYGGRAAPQVPPLALPSAAQ
jgi:hypothetical protein